jgi:hypothetical protein
MNVFIEIKKGQIEENIKHLTIYLNLNLFVDFIRFSDYIDVSTV